MEGISQKDTTNLRRFTLNPNFLLMQQLQINELNGRLAQLHEQLEGAGAGAGAAGARKKRPGSREHLPPM
jgi:hypothetical protein